MSLKRIDELFNFEKGELQSSKSTPGNYNFITASAEWKTHKEYTHDCEALIFAAAASGSLGRTHYVKGKFISSDLCFIITPKDNKNLPVDLKFYHLLFNSLRDEIVRNTKAGTSKEAIGLTSFGKYEIPYFSMEKQKEIKIKFLKVQESNIDISAEFKLQQDLLTQLRQSFLQEAMQGKLVKQDSKEGHAKDLLEKLKAEKAKSGKKEKDMPPIKREEIPFGIPENWVWCRLGEISYIQTGIALGKKFAGKLHKYPYLRVANVQRGSVDLSTVKYLELPKEIAKKYYLKQLDILVNEGGDFDKVGRCAIWGASIQPCIHQNHIFAVRIDGVNQQYFEYAINSDSSRDYFLGTYKKSTNLASLNKTNLNLLPVPLPPLNEQNRIVEKLSELMNLCDDLQQSIQTSRDQNEYLLQQVLKEALKVNK